MIQWFFLVILPGVAPYVAMAFIGYFLWHWMAPRIARKRAEARRLSGEVRKIEHYAAEASEAIAELTVELASGRGGSLPQELERKIYSLASEPMPQLQKKGHR